MDFSIWTILAVVFFVVAAILLIVTIMLFIRLEIASVIGFLTGKTQAKQVQEIRAQALSSSNYSPRKNSPSTNGSKFDDIISSSANTSDRSKMQNIAHASKRLNNDSGHMITPSVVQKNDRFAKISVNDDKTESTSVLESSSVESNKTERNTKNIAVNSNLISKDSEEATSALSNVEDNVDPTSLLSDYDENTSKLNDNELTSKLTDKKIDIATSVLTEFDEDENSMSTEVLENDKEYSNMTDGTVVLNNYEDENDETEGTSVLSNNAEIQTRKLSIEIIEDETSILTDEVIK